MNEPDKERLYEAIDQDDNLSDSEKREIYFAEIERMEDEGNWEK